MRDPAIGRIYLPRFEDARAAATRAGFDRVVTYGGPVPVSEWMSTREEVAPGSVVYYLEGAALREAATCTGPGCRLPFEGPYPDEAAFDAAPLRPCCRRFAESHRPHGFILGIWPLLRPGEAPPPSTVPEKRPASLPAGDPWPPLPSARLG